MESGPRSECKTCLGVFKLDRYLNISRTFVHRTEPSILIKPPTSSVINQKKTDFIFPLFNDSFCITSHGAPGSGSLNLSGPEKGRSSGSDGVSFQTAVGSSVQKDRREPVLTGANRLLLFRQVSQGDATEKLAHQIAAQVAAPDRGAEEASGDPHEEKKDEAHKSSKGHISGKYGLWFQPGPPEPAELASLPRLRFRI